MMQQTSVHDDTGFWWDRTEGFWWDRPDGAMLATLLGNSISPLRRRGRPRGPVKPYVDKSEYKEQKRAEIISKLKECAARGMTRTEAAAYVGVCVQTSYNYARLNGITFQRQKIVIIMQRANRMAEMYVNGKTLEEIGVEFKVTRERVRQIIKKHHGMTFIDGGYHIRAIRNAEQRATKANAKCLAKWGCTLVQLRQIPSNARYSYQQKRRNVINVYGRNAWAMTLWDYYSAWEASGLLGQIGTNRGKYGMTRIDDLLPFTIDNVEIITQAESSLRVIAKIRARTVSVCAAKT